MGNNSGKEEEGDDEDVMELFFCLKDDFLFCMSQRFVISAVFFFAVSDFSLQETTAQVKVNHLQELRAPAVAVADFTPNQFVLILG